MTKEKLAEQLNGCEIGKEISREFKAVAKNNGLVVIFGASDDLMEFRGAIDDECGAYSGTTALIDAKGLLPDRDQIDDDDVLEDFFHRRKTAKEVNVIWCGTKEYSWTYETELPHASFDVMEDGKKYCRGIILKLPSLENEK